jgi:DNA-binding transcriptional LysR family regulator
MANAYGTLIGAPRTDLALLGIGTEVSEGSTCPKTHFWGRSGRATLPPRLRVPARCLQISVTRCTLSRRIDLSNKFTRCFSSLSKIWMDTMLDGVTLNQLRTFVAVCDEASFSGAARKLRRAQSAVSHAVAALEAVLNVQLFERDTQRRELSAAGRSLLPDARAVIARTEEMKTRARSIADVGAPQLSIAMDAYFPRKHLIRCLQAVQHGSPNAVINLQMTTMQGGEVLLLDGTCSLAVTVADVPELKVSAIERHWLCEAQMVTVCAPSHPLAAVDGPISRDEFSRHVQLVVTDNQPNAEKTQIEVASKRQWLVNDLSAKHDFLRAGLGWGHMPADLVADDLAIGARIQVERRAWHLRPMAFMVSRRRGHELSACEGQLIDLLADIGADVARPIKGLARRSKLRSETA